MHTLSTFLWRLHTTTYVSWLPLHTHTHSTFLSRLHTTATTSLLRHLTPEISIHVHLSTSLTVTVQTCQDLTNFLSYIVHFIILADNLDFTCTETIVTLEEDYRLVAQGMHLCVHWWYQSLLKMTIILLLYDWNFLIRQHIFTKLFSIFGFCSHLSLIDHGFNILHHTTTRSSLIHSQADLMSSFLCPKWEEGRVGGQRHSATYSWWCWLSLLIYASGVQEHCNFLILPIIYVNQY